EGFITLLHLGAYFLVASSVLDTEKWWYRLFATSVGVSAFLGIYGILQLAGVIVINQGGVRLDGTFGNAAYFAGYMLFHLFLTLFLILRHRVPANRKWMYGAAMLLQLFVLYFSATRGAAVGLIGGLLLSSLLLALFEKQNRSLRKWAIGTIVGVLVVVGAIYSVRNVEWVAKNPVLSRFATINLQSAPARFMVWGMAFEGFKENPILGWGQEGFNFVFNKYYNPDMWSQEAWFDRTHNIFFDWLIAGGLLGLLAYLSLHAGLLYYIWKGKPESSATPFSFAEKSVLTGLLAAYVVQNLFVFDNIGTYILFFSLLAFMHSRVSVPTRLAALPALSKGAVSQTALASVTVLFIAVLYFANVRGIALAQDLIAGLKSHPKGLGENLEAYRRASKKNMVGRQETAEQFLQAAVAVTGAAGAPAEIKETFAKEAAETMEREVEHVPSDARLSVFLGVFYNRMRAFDKALGHLSKAHELSPTKQTITFEIANVYLNQGKFNEALVLLKEAYELAPEFDEARKVYAVAAIYANRFDLVEALLVPKYGTIAVSDDRIVKAYYDVKRYAPVLEIWKERVAKNPDNAQMRTSLAAAYLLLGDRKKAIAEIEEAIRINPEFKAQGDYFISEIRAGRNP
ncbi:MAG: O-antigen ligase family protein, partial [bacterium]|nr:O-antigen ligase family protein [bacterium]